MPALGAPAAPMAAKVAVRTMINWSPNANSWPKTWQRKTGATACIKLDASMLMVAPTGQTKLAISFSTPRPSSAASMVTGRVAMLELVEKATN